jgi:insecticidal toxin complex protein TccC
MVRNRPINFGDLDGYTGTELTLGNIIRIANIIKKDMGELPREDVLDVVNQYLKGKGADPQQYAETIMSRLGFAAAAAIAESQSTPQATTNYREPTNNEKKGLHIFWSTNAGAKYINGIARDYFTEGLRSSVTTPNVMISFKEARKEALRELRTNNGSTGAIKLTSTQQEQFLEPALELLAASSNNAKHTVLLMGDSLGTPLKGELYRGARLTYTGFNKGDIVETSGFTSFTPDRKTAIKFMDKFHDSAFKSSTHSVLFVAKGASSVNNSFESEGVFPPGTQFKVTDDFQERKTGIRYVMLEKTTAPPSRYHFWI